MNNELKGIRKGNGCILKKKPMHLPILSLQTEPAIKKIPVSIKKTFRKQAQKKSIEQLLNIIEKPKPTTQYFWKGKIEQSNSRNMLHCQAGYRRSSSLHDSQQ